MLAHGSYITILLKNGVGGSVVKFKPALSPNAQLIALFCEKPVGAKAPTG